MDSTMNSGNDRLASTFTFFKMAFYLASDKNKIHDYMIAFIIPGVIFIFLFGFSFISFILFPEKRALIPLIQLSIILPFVLVAFLGILSSFNFKHKLSYDEIIVEGFKLLFPFLWLALINIFIIFIGLCLLIIPGIFWGVKYSLSIGVMVFEGKKGFKALSRSKALTQKHFFYLLLNYGALGAVILLTFLVVLFFPIDQHTILNLLQVFIIIFAGIFASAFYYCMFKQLSSRHQITMEESSLDTEDSESKLEQYTAT